MSVITIGQFIPELAKKIKALVQNDREYDRAVDSILEEQRGENIQMNCLEEHLEPQWDGATQMSCDLARKRGYTYKDSYEVYHV